MFAEIDRALQVGRRVAEKRRTARWNIETVYVEDDAPPASDPLKEVAAAWSPAAFWLKHPDSRPMLTLPIHPSLVQYTLERPHPRIVLSTDVDAEFVKARGRWMVAYQHALGIRTRSSWDLLLDLRPALRDIESQSYGTVKAAAQWLFNPHLCPETCYTLLPVYAWSECEELSASMTRREAAPTPRSSIVRMVSLCFRYGDGAAPLALRILDGILSYNHPSDRRTLRYRRRHKFDLINIILAAAAAWGRGAHSGLLKSSMISTICMMMSARMNYERMLVTFTYIFDSGYWPMICSLEMRERSHLLSLADWIRLHKEYTATIVRTWTWPYSMSQTMAAVYLIDAHTAVGWADNAPDGGDSLIKTLRCASGEPTTYTIPGGTEADYYTRFQAIGDTLLRDQFASSARKVVRMSQFSELRVANMSPGAAGGLVRRMYGQDRIPQGCSKAYAASALSKEEFLSTPKATITVVDKPDERGVQRGLAAADMFTVRDEQYSFSPISRGMVWTGADLAETDLQRGDRLVRQIGCAIAPVTIACFDWEAYDQHMTFREKLCLLESARRNVDVVHDPVARNDMQDAIMRVIGSHLGAEFVSPAFGVGRRGREVDAMIASRKGRMARTSDSGVYIRQVEAQQSGRGNTLEMNGEIALVRTLLRDSVSGTEPMERNSRGDDLFEGYTSWADAVEATLTFIDMGNRANIRKLSVQDHSGVYFKVIYAGGSRPCRRGMPARVALSLVSRKPAIGAAPFPSFRESIAGGVSACNRGVRRGLSPAFCSYLAEDCVSYNCRTVPQVSSLSRCAQKSGGFKVRRVTRNASKAYVRAAAIHGGCGVTPVGVTAHDLSLKVDRSRGNGPIKDSLAAEQRRILKRGGLPGVDDLVRVTREEFTTRHGLEVTAAAEQAFRDQAAMGSWMQNGSGDLASLTKGMEQLGAYSRVHRDLQNSVYHIPHLTRHSIGVVTAVREALFLYRKLPGNTRRPLSDRWPMDEALPGIGILASLDRGLAKIMVQNAEPEARWNIAQLLCTQSASGTAFVARTTAWPTWLRLELLLGKHMFPGTWDALISPDLFGVFKIMCYFGLEDDVVTHPQEHKSRYRSYIRFAAVVEACGQFFHVNLLDYNLE